jgi:hypothetical protein
MEKEILTLMRKDLLLVEDNLMVMNAIENGFIDTCDLFEDFVTYVSENANVDYDTLINYQEHYQNLLSQRENLCILLDEVSPI